MIHRVLSGMLDSTHSLCEHTVTRRITNRRPPRFLRAGSIGAASGLICFTGGGSCNLSSFCSISARMPSPTAPLGDSWKLSTRAARLHLAATRRAAFRRKSYIITHANYMSDNTLYNCYNTTFIFTAIIYATNEVMYIQKISSLHRPNRPWYYKQSTKQTVTLQKPIVCAICA